MSADDQQRWDERYAAAAMRAGSSSQSGSSSQGGLPTPSGLVGFEGLLPSTGNALDIACGAGDGSMWLAERGLEVIGVDVSPVAVDQSRQRAADAGLSDQCRFQVHDLDQGLPDGPRVELVTCHLFNAPDLDGLMLQRLVPGGVLAVTVLSEVGAEPGPFRVGAQELVARFAAAKVLGHREGNGQATIVVQAAGPQPHGRLD